MSEVRPMGDVVRVGHTPGPWGPETRVNVRGVRCQLGFLNANEGSPSDLNSRANARLIEASPLLLDALINLYGIAVDEGIVGDSTTLEAARAAIAAATGSAGE